MSPAQIDTCTTDLLRDSFAAAEARGLPLTVHCAQSVNEFLVMVDRHGCSPVQFAHGLGILSPRTVLGHAMFIDEHSWVRWHTRTDLGLLADTGTHVAHCPSPFARYGHTLEDFGRYRRAGVNLGIGTDVAPHNVIEEMRLAAILARVAARDITPPAWARCSMPPPPAVRTRWGGRISGACRRAQRRTSCWWTWQIHGCGRRAIRCARWCSPPRIERSRRCSCTERR